MDVGKGTVRQVRELISGYSRGRLSEPVAPGSFAASAGGLEYIADDFDETPEEFREYME